MGQKPSKNSVYIQLPDKVASTDKPFGVGASLIALESESVAISCLDIIQNFSMIYKGSAVIQIIHDMYWTFKESQIKYFSNEERQKGKIIFKNWEEIQASFFHFPYQCVHTTK